MSKLAFIFLLLGGFLTLFLFRQSELRQLRAQREHLRQSAKEAIRVAEENARLPKPETDSAELENLRPMVLELARLRAEIPRLREAARLQPEVAKEEIMRAESQAEDQQHRIELIQARFQTSQLNKEIKQMMKNLLHLTQMVVDSRSRRPTVNPIFPASFPELQDRLTAFETEWFKSQALEEFSFTKISELHFPPGSPTEYFEFIPQPKPLTLSDPPALLFRERVPRTHPDGGFIRIYGISTGGALEAILPENRFHEWEQTWSPPERGLLGSHLEN